MVSGVVDEIEEFRWIYDLKGIPESLDKFVCLDISKRYEVSQKQIKKRVVSQNDAATRRNVFYVPCNHGKLSTYIISSISDKLPATCSVDIAHVRCDQTSRYSDGQGRGYYHFITGQCPKCKTIYAFYVGQW